MPASSEVNQVSTEFLRVEHISKRFSGVKALIDVSFSIRRGTVVGLVGENGSGKSTMIKIISGVYEPDDGDLFIDGRHYKKLTPIIAIQDGIQVIYQDFLLFPNLTVAENIGVNRIISHRRSIIDWKKVYQESKEALARVGVAIPLDALVDDLSTADRQVIAIARALLEDSRLVIMDEPTTALTWREVQNLFQTINEIKKQGISVLFVSHKLNEVKEISDRVIVFRDGRKDLDEEAQNIDIKTIEFHMTGRRIDTDSISYSTPEKREPPLLRVKNLTLEQGFQNVSFDLWHKEVLGITGLLGSGRTELARSMFGELPASSGTIDLHGQRISIRSIQDAIVHGIAYVPDDRVNEGLFLLQSIADNLTVRVISDLSRSMGIIDHQKKYMVVRDWIERLDIKAPKMKNPVSSLSGGNQQRVVLAKWLESHPIILILNNPTVGVDVGSKAYIHELIRQLARQDVGIILISDDLPELLRTCNRILIMRQGVIVQEFSQGEVNEEELHQCLVSNAR